MPEAPDSIVLETRPGSTARVVPVSTIERGRGPRPGMHAEPFLWRDVVGAPPPRRRTRGEGAYAVYHALELDADIRISYSTVVGVDPGADPDDPHDDVVQAETRIGVQHRLFLEFIHRERAVMERLTSRWRQGVIRHLVRQRVGAKRLPWTWSRRAALAVVRAEGRAAMWGIRSVRGASRLLIELPDSLYSRSVRARQHLEARLSRQGLWAGMRNPRSLSAEQKSVVLFLSAAILLSGVLLLNAVVPFLFPSIAGAYRDIVTTFLFGVATAVALPFPPSELLVIPPYLSAGPVWAFLSIVGSKVAGAWLVFFFGDALNDAIRRRTVGRPRMERIVQWMQRNSEKYGFYILATFMTMPFLPDTLALYVFAVSGASFRGYLGAALVGSVIRYAGVVALLALFGEAYVVELFGR